MPKRNNENESNSVPSKLIKTNNLEECTQKAPSIVEVITETKKTDDKIEAVPSTSHSVIEDRYSYNYWSKETNNEEPGKKVLKIKDLSIGKIEHTTLTVRIAYKSEMKDTKFGRVVSCLLMDETGEVALVSYGKIAIELYNNWKHNQVYAIQNFEVQTENVDYPSGSGNVFQIRANQNFHYREDDGNTLPPISFSFQSIDDVKTYQRNTRVDVIGILLQDHGLEKNSSNVPMRDLLITDQKKGLIIATLWGKAAEKFVAQEKSVIAIRKGVIGSFREKIKINCTMGTLVWTNPTISESSPIIKWFNENDKNKLKS